VPEAYVLETLRTARTTASPRGGFAGISPVDLLVTMQRELVTRNELDAYGLETQARAVRAWDEGFFDRSLVPVTRPAGVVVARDEHLPCYDVADAGRRPGAGADRDAGRGEADRGGTAGPDRRLGYGIAAVSGAAGLGVAALVERVTS
jgi:hypothetical protein